MPSKSFWDQHVLHPAGMLNKDTPKGHGAVRQYIATIDGFAPPGGSDPDGGKDRRGKGVSPHGPEPQALPWYPPTPPEDPWTHAPAQWTRKEERAWNLQQQKGEKGNKGKGTKGKGKEGKGKGKKGAAAKAKAKAAALWDAWRTEGSGK